MQNSPVYILPLDTRPNLRAMGNAVHGARVLEETWQMDTLWCMHFYTYRGELCLDGQTLSINPGTVSIVPPGTQMIYRYRGLSQHYYAHFKLPSVSSAKVCKNVPAIQNTGSIRGSFSASFDQAISFFSTSTLRTEIRLWDLLWQLAGAAERKSPQIHPAAQEACAIIEAKLNKPLSIANLAEKVGLSHNHLTRLFRHHFGQTVAQYIRSRRANLAEHMLRETTLPIKAIAYHIGVPDLHQFNKLIHATKGTSPRKLRDMR